MRGVCGCVFFVCVVCFLGTAMENEETSTRRYDRGSSSSTEVVEGWRGGKENRPDPDFGDLQRKKERFATSKRQKGSFTCSLLWGVPFLHLMSSECYCLLTLRFNCRGRFVSSAVTEYHVLTDSDDGHGE